MSNLSVGAPQVFENLTLFPLLRDGDGPGGSGEWSLLADALEAGTVEVREVDDNGVVGELVAVNRGPRPVLILDGEQLIGAKQNRTTARTILLGAESETRIPVSCMEQGRWRHASRRMRHGREHSPSTVRRHARRVEADAAREPERSDDDRGRDASPGRRPRDPRRSPTSQLLGMAQVGVWSSVAESQDRSGVRSRTGALDEVYARRKAGLDAWQEQLPSLPGQVGVLAFVDGEPAGLDVLAGPEVYARVHDRLVRSYAFEAMDAAVGRIDRDEERDGRSATGAPVVEPSAGEAFLAAASGAARHPMETVGLGQYAAVAGEGSAGEGQGGIGDVVGGELTWEEGVVHLSAFARA